MINFIPDKVLSDTSQVMMLVTMGKVLSVKIISLKLLTTSLYKIYILPRLCGGHVW
jgi:hypothetical protein